MREIRKSGSVGEAVPKHQGEGYTGTKAETLDTAKPEPKSVNARLYPATAKPEAGPEPTDVGRSSFEPMIG